MEKYIADYSNADVINVTVSTNIEALEALGWELTHTYEYLAQRDNISLDEARKATSDEYDVHIHVQGKKGNISTFYNLVSENNCSEWEKTGDDKATIEDILNLLNKNQVQILKDHSYSYNSSIIVDFFRKQYGRYEVGEIINCVEYNKYEGEEPQHVKLEVSTVYPNGFTARKVILNEAGEIVARSKSYAKFSNKSYTGWDLDTFYINSCHEPLVDNDDIRPYSNVDGILDKLCEIAIVDLKLPVIPFNEIFITDDN